MAVAWIDLLKNIPWGTVLARAPDVAESASKLWNSVGRQQQRAEAESEHAEPEPANPLIALDARLDSVEGAVADLRQQMNQCTGLVAQLAEQNSMLVARAEMGRRRIIQLSVATGGAILVALIALVVAFR